MLVKEMAAAAQCDFNIRKELIERYIPTVENIAKKYENNDAGIELEDLIQIGLEEMINTIDGYGYKESTILSAYIYRSVKNKFESIIKNEKKYIENSIYNRDLYCPIQDVEDKVFLSQFKVVVTGIILKNALSPRRCFVIELLYSDSFSVKETAYRLGITTERVYQLRNSALNIIRRSQGHYKDPILWSFAQEEINKV